MTIWKAATVALALSLCANGFARAEGAIAVDDNAESRPSDAGYGIGFGDDKDSAEAAALKKCRAIGNDSCRVAVWFETCGAYASSNDHYGVGWGTSIEKARESALDKCGNNNCRVVAADCGD